MPKEHSTLFATFCYLMDRLAALSPGSARLEELHQHAKVALWDHDGAAWARFLRTRGHLLARGGPRALLQEALSLADTSPVTRAAEAYLDAGLLQGGYYLRRLGRPKEVEPSALKRTLEGHRGPVSALALTPQGHLLSAGSDKTMRLWDLETGETLRVFSGATGWINALVLFADGRRALSQGEKEILLWDLSSGEILERFESFSYRWYGLALDPEEKTFLSGDGHGEFRQYDLASGETLLRLRGHDMRTLCLSFLPGARALSGSVDGTVRLWDLETGACLSRLWEDAGKVRALAVDPTGRTLLASDTSGSIRYWDLKSGRLLSQLCEYGNSGSALTLAFSPDGRRAISGGFDGVLRLWDLKGPNLLKELPTPSGDIHAAIFYQGERQAILGCNNGAIQIVSLEGDVKVSGPVRHTDQVVALAVHREEPYALSACFDGVLLLWDTSTGRLLYRLFESRLPLSAAASHPTRPLGASAGWDRDIHLWDLQSGLRLQTFAGHTDPIRRLAFTPDGQRLLSIDDKTLRVWDLDTGLSRVIAEEHLWPALLAHPDNRRAITVSRGTYVKLWDIESGDCLRTIEGSPHLTLHPDGRRLLVAGEKDLTIWELDEGRALLSLPTPVKASPSIKGELGVGALALLPDGERLLYGGQDGALSLWTLTTGERLKTFAAHTGAVRQVVPHKDGRTLFSVGDDRLLLVWDLERGERVAAWELEAGCTNLATDAKDRLLCTGETGEVLILKLSQG